MELDKGGRTIKITRIVGDLYGRYVLICERAS